MTGLLFGVLSIVLLIVGIGAVYLVWYLWGRDPDVGEVPEYLTEPPSELSPGLVGVLVDERADMRDITATLLDLGRQGYLTLEEQKHSRGNSYLFKKTKAADTSGMSSFEKNVYLSLFGDDDRQDLSGGLPPFFFDNLPYVQQNMYRELVTQGYFRQDPGAIRSRYTSLTIFAAIVVFVVGVVLLANAVVPAGVLLGPVIFVVGLFVITPRMPAKTRKGAEAAERWRAFHKYLQNLKKYTDVKTAADQFERYLPFAVAFGMERAWINTFSQAKDINVPMPGWYRVYPIARPGVPIGGLATETGGSPPVVGTAAGQAAARTASKSAAGVGGAVSTPAAAQTGKPAATGPQPASLTGGLNEMGAGLVGGLNEMSSGLIGALNETGRAISTPPSSPDSGFFKGLGPSTSGGKGGSTAWNSGSSDFWGKTGSKGVGGRSYRQSFGSRGGYRSSSKGSSFGSSSRRRSSFSSSRRSSSFGRSKGFSSRRRSSFGSSRRSSSRRSSFGGKGRR